MKDRFPVDDVHRRPTKESYIDKDGFTVEKFPNGMTFIYKPFPPFYSNKMYPITPEEALDYNEVHVLKEYGIMKKNDKIAKI